MGLSGQSKYGGCFPAWDQQEVLLRGWGMALEFWDQQGILQGGWGVVLGSWNHQEALNRGWGGGMALDCIVKFRRL